MYVNKNIYDLDRVRSEEGRIEYLRLDMNENPEGLPIDFFKKVMAKITPEILSMYPEINELKHLIAKTHYINPQNITLTNGSDEALRTIFEVFGESGKKLICVNPTFAMYHIYAKMFGMQCDFVSYNENFKVSIVEICNKITSDVGIVALVNPNNPMGNVYLESEIKCIADKAQQENCLVIIDEAYHYFYNQSFIDMLKIYDNIIVTRTFSKLCSVAGLRIGYAVSSERISKFLNNALSTYNVNSVGVLFAKEILKNDKLIVSLVEQELEGREYVKSQLKLRNYDFFSGEGNFIFIKTNNHYLDIERQLKERYILVKTYGNPILNGYIRISTGSKKIMTTFLNTFFELDN